MASTQEALLKSVTEPAFLTPEAYRAAMGKSLKERTFSLGIGPLPQPLDGSQDPHASYLRNPTCG